MATKIQHPTLGHPLEPLDVSDGPAYAYPLCVLCGFEIQDVAYSCEEDRWSYFHKECAEEPGSIEHHPLHPIHPLTLLLKSPPSECDACGRNLSSGCSSFRCDECHFVLGRGCAWDALLDGGGFQEKNSVPIALWRHPHQLTSSFIGHDSVRYMNCVICRTSVDGDGYMCSDTWCKFSIHKRCVQDLFYADGTKAPLQLPAHDHPLVPRDSRLMSIAPGCDLCHRKIRAEAYTCRECKSFYHRVCAEAPPQLERHPLHPAHPLALIHRRPSLKCAACNELFNSGGSSFSCKPCKFDLDISCALSTILDQGGSQGKTLEQITLPFHPHLLTFFSTSHAFVPGGVCVICRASVELDGYMCLNRRCDFLIHKQCIQDLYYADGTKAPRFYHGHRLEIIVGEDKGSSRCSYCGSNKSGEFIGCASCQVFIHRDCIPAPEILQYPLHPDHTLVLLINRPDNTELRCGSCSDYLEVQLSYRCTSCEFSVDAKCALQTLAYCEEGLSPSVKWTWHKHPLFLCHKTKLGSNYCSCCGDESTGATYACNTRGCRFLLHEQCVRIQPTMIHPYHPDQLTLQREDDGPPPLCEACCKEIFGFSFSCELCEFYLHVKCATRVPTRKHYLHEHELLRFDEVPSLECNRCSDSTDSPLLRCFLCNFNLHEKCMELPRVVKHDTHGHPLTLRECYIEDDSGEYYCDLCEKRRDSRLGVYVCEQCRARWAFHIDCVLPELRKVFEKKGQTSAVKRLDKRIDRANEIVRKGEKKLEETKQELDRAKQKLDELMKQRAELIYREEKNYAAVTEEGEPENSV